MAGRPPQFKLRDVTRAFRAAEAAGVRDPRVEVKCPNGSVITIDSKPDKGTAAPMPGKVPPSRSSRPAR
jgi:hypothetical protein